ncbi:MAG: amidohydrolase family protein, partial [Ilumatobacteraceae bacterium]
MIVDCHGHYTTAPPQLGAYRDAQIAALADDALHVGERGTIDISDDELRNSLEPNQLRLQRERGLDLTLFSPRASWMGHHVGNQHTSRFWTEHSNDLIRRICDLYPDNFAPVCQLPQSPGASLDASVDELRRCVEQMGFVGCNLNPDPSGGNWTGPTLDDRAFWPLYEAMCELDVPAMIHVSATCNPHFHSTGSHYLGADTTAFMQALTSGLFRDFPEMRWIIPHGGGAVPYHWGRFKGMAEEQGWQTLDELMHNI